MGLLHHDDGFYYSVFVITDFPIFWHVLFFFLIYLYYVICFLKESFFSYRLSELLCRLSMFVICLSLFLIFLDLVPNSFLIHLLIFVPNSFPIHLLNFVPNSFFIHLLHLVLILFLIHLLNFAPIHLFITPASESISINSTFCHFWHLRRNFYVSLAKLY